MSRKIAPLVAALALGGLVAATAHGSTASSRSGQSGYIPVTFDGYAPGWLYPGKVAVFYQDANLTNSRVRPIRDVEVQLYSKSPQLGLIKKGSARFTNVGGKPTWRFRKVSYHVITETTKLSQLTKLSFYVSRRVKPKQKLCLTFRIKVRSTTVLEPPLCVHVAPRSRW